MAELFDLESFLVFLVLGFSGILFAVSLLAYFRVRHPRLLFISLAFGVFAFKGGLLAWGVFSADGLHAPIELLVFDVLVILLIYFSAAKR